MCVQSINTFKPGQNGHHFADIFKLIFFNENLILIQISLEMFPKGQVNNISALAQMVA